MTMNLADFRRLQVVVMILAILPLCGCYLTAPAEPTAAETAGESGALQGPESNAVTSETKPSAGQPSTKDATTTDKDVSGKHVGNAQAGSTSAKEKDPASSTLDRKPVVRVKKEPLKLITEEKKNLPDPKPDAENPYGLKDGLYAEMKTTKGTIVFELFRRRAPLTVANFVGLAEGTKFSNRQGHLFYDGLPFHRVVRNLLVQSGDPTGKGKGGPGYTFPDEIHPDLKHDAAGTVAMANRGIGTNTNGSQFYITLKATPWLDGAYSVFGKVVKGLEVLTTIRKGDRIKSVRILRIGEDAGKYRVTQDSFNKIYNDKFGNHKRVNGNKTKKYESEKIILEKFLPPEEKK